MFAGMPIFRNILFFVFSFLIYDICGAQTISGRVSDASGNPLPMASVIVLKDSVLVFTTITAEDGRFDGRYGFVSGATYVVRASAIGYTTTSLSFRFPDMAKLHDIRLEADGKLLGEISVTARKPLVVRRADRYIVNIENSILANGRSALEVLQQTPGVWVDNNGIIRLRGTQAVTVMINDVVQRMTDEELADYLRSLKSEDISRIEVISNPPSEFEASGTGGILHIILKKQKRDGWNGSVNTQYWQQGTRPYFTTAVTANYGVKKLYFSGTYSFVKDIRSIIEKASIGYPDLSAYSNRTDRREKITRNQYRLSAVYDIDQRQSLSAQGAFSVTDFRTIFNTTELYSGSQPSAGTARSEKYRRFDLAAVTVNYTLKLDTSGGYLKIIGDFTNNSREEHNLFFRQKETPLQQRTWRNNSPIDTRIYSIQSDISKNIQGVNWKGGWKYASIKRDNTLLTEDFAGVQWIVNSGQSNRFIYDEQLLMGYASMEKTVNRSMVKAGIRGEQTWSHGNALTTAQVFRRSYFGLFPSVFWMQTFNAQKGNTISFGYSRRLTRPSLSDLNPARLEFSNYTALVGNPRLLPQYSHNLSIAYQLLRNHAAEIYFTRTKNAIALSARTGAGNSIDYYSENTGNTDQYGISLSSAVTAARQWSITNNFSAYRSAYNFQGDRYRQASWYARSIHTVTLTGIEFELAADYRSPYIYTNLYTYGNFSLDAGVTRRLFSNKGRVRLGFTDIFNSSREKELTDEDHTLLRFYRKRPTRTVRLSFSYNFSSGKKLAAKRVDQGNAEERGRIGN